MRLLIKAHWDWSEFDYIYNDTLVREFAELLVVSRFSFDAEGSGSTL